MFNILNTGQKNYHYKHCRLSLLSSGQILLGFMRKESKLVVHFRLVFFAVRLQEKHTVRHPGRLCQQMTPESSRWVVVEFHRARLHNRNNKVRQQCRHHCCVIPEIRAKVIFPLLELNHHTSTSSAYARPVMLSPEQHFVWLAVVYDLTNSAIA